MRSVFLSYSREDEPQAERLYMDLRRAEINVWMDSKCLLPGQNWQHEIRRAIRKSAYFMALLSKRSLGKRGYVQSEIKQALRALEEVPSDQIFFIPVRLEACEPSDEELRNLNWVDLFPSYRKGFQRLLSVLADIEKAPLVFYDPSAPIGYRAPIEYTPYRSFELFVRDLIGKLPDAAHFHDRDHSFFITYRTNEEGVLLPDYLRAKYPEKITIVLRAAYKCLGAEDDSFSVEVMFDQKWEALRVPYSCVDEIVVPEISLLVKRISRGT